MILLWGGVVFFVLCLFFGFFGLFFFYCIGFLTLDKCIGYFGGILDRDN